MIEPLHTPFFKLQKAVDNFKQTGAEQPQIREDALIAIAIINDFLENSDQYKDQYYDKIKLIVYNLEIYREALQLIDITLLSELYFTNPSQLAKIILFTPEFPKLRNLSEAEITNQLLPAIKKEPNTPLPVFKRHMNEMASIFNRLTELQQPY
jgi:hypothetical protein